MLELSRVPFQRRYNFLLVQCLLFVFATLPPLCVAQKTRQMRGTSLQGRRMQDSSAQCGDGPPSRFQNNITIDYSVVCQSLIASDIALLEDSILNTYNDMVQSQYCDPSSRRITNVTYVSETNGANEGQLSIQFLIIGSCQGCNTTSSSIFDQVNYTTTTGGIVLTTSNTTSCSCPDNVVASRAPTQDEFLGAYENALLELSQQLICVTTIFGGVIPTERPSLAPTVLAFDCPVNLSIPLTSQVLVTLNANATQSTFEELGQDLIDTYNALINATYSTCQTTKYRQITNFTILTTTTSTIDGSRVRGRQLTGIPISPEDIVIQVDGGCAGCNATELFFDPDVLSREDFVVFYDRSVDTGLDYLNEVVTMECPSIINTFDIIVIVEYVPGTIDSETLSSNGTLQQELADIYMTSYNDLSRDFCDPYSRQLESAAITLVGENNTFGNIPVEMALVVTCSDCNGLNLSVFDEPVTQQPVLVTNATTNATVINSTGTVSHRVLQSMSRMPMSMYLSKSGRSLQDTNVVGSCYCPAHPVGDRAPYETEFLDAYRHAVNDTSEPTAGQAARQLQVQTVDTFDLGSLLSVAECQFGTRFQTGIYVQFQVSVQDLTDDIIQSIQDALLQSISALYQTSETVCDPEFRIFNDVEATVVGDASTRRKLQQSYRERQVQQVVTEAPSISPVPSSSPAPSVSHRPSFSLAGAQSQAPTFSLAGSPTQVPTMPTLDSGVVDSFLYVSGVCNGCDNSITLSDQTNNGRRLQRVENEWFRQIQETVAQSGCFCPIGSDILEPPTLDQLLNVFSTNLVARNITFEILAFSEVPVIDCTVPVTDFTTQFEYTIALEPDVTSDQLQAIGDVVQSTYNSLSQDYCDPLDQTIDSVQVVQYSPSNNGVVGQNQSQDYDVTFQVIGTCRGCDGSALLASTTTSAGRRLEIGQDSYASFSSVLFATQQNVSRVSIATATMQRLLSSSRRLQVATDSASECFCTGNVVANEAPDTEAFNSAFSTALNAFELTNVCGFPDLFPSTQPTLVPTLLPTSSPTLLPTVSPTLLPTLSPTSLPTLSPSDHPTVKPSLIPSLIPFGGLSTSPTASAALPITVSPTPGIGPPVAAPVAVPPFFFATPSPTIAAPV